MKKEIMNQTLCMNEKYKKFNKKETMLYAQWMCFMLISGFGLFLAIA